MAKKISNDNKVSVLNNDFPVSIMSDNNFSVGITIGLNQSIAYGATVVVPATGEAHTFSPNAGVTALNICSLGMSADNAVGVIGYAISSINFPLTLTYNGVTSATPMFFFDITATNLSAHGGTFIENVAVSVSAAGIALSAGVAGTMSDGTWYSSVDSITALGDVVAPASVTNLTGSRSQSTTLLTWTNPVSDYYRTMIIRSDSAPVTGYSLGTVVYVGTATTFNDTAASALSTSRYYGAVVSDLVGLSSVITEWNSQGDVTVSSPVTGFNVTLSSVAILGWTNPTNVDYVATKIRRSNTNPVSTVDIGTQIYTGTGVTYIDTAASGVDVYYYGAYTVDTAGWASPIVQLVTRLIPAGYPAVPAGYPAEWSQLDPNSTTELKWTRYLRLLNEGEI